MFQNKLQNLIFRRNMDSRGSCSDLIAQLDVLGKALDQKIEVVTSTWKSFYTLLRFVSCIFVLKYVFSIRICISLVWTRLMLS